MECGGICIDDRYVCRGGLGCMTVIKLHRLAFDYQDYQLSCGILARFLKQQ